MHSTLRIPESNNGRRSPQYVATPQPQQFPPALELFMWSDVWNHLRDEQALPMTFVGRDGDRLIAETKTLVYTRDVLEELGHYRIEHLCCCVAYTLKRSYPHSPELCVLARDAAELQLVQDCEEVLQRMDLEVQFTPTFRPNPKK